MSPAAIEIVVTNVGNHTINDENTEDGKKWLEAFRSGAENIRGCRRACWASSQRDSHIAMHFIDYQSHKQHNDHKDTDFGGSGIAPDLKDIMDPNGTDLYVMYPHTPDRHVLYAPQTNVVFFYGLDDDKFAELAPEFFTAIEKSDSCLGYIWGEFQPPARNDSSDHMSLGRGGIMISGWRSREEHDRDVQKPRVTEAYKGMAAACKKKDTWGMQVNIVENNGHFHKWRRLTKIDRSNLLLTAGTHAQTL